MYSAPAAFLAAFQVAVPPAGQVPSTILFSVNVVGAGVVDPVVIIDGDSPLDPYRYVRGFRDRGLWDAFYGARPRVVGVLPGGEGRSFLVEPSPAQSCFDLTARIATTERAFPSFLATTDTTWQSPLVARSLADEERQQHLELAQAAAQTAGVVMEATALESVGRALLVGRLYTSDSVAIGGYRAMAPDDGTDVGVLIGVRWTNGERRAVLVRVNAASGDGSGYWSVLGAVSLPSGHVVVVVRGVGYEGWTYEVLGVQGDTLSSVYVGGGGGC